MKLRNKKTGEIGNLVLNINPNRESYSVLSTENGDTVCGNLVIADYNSLAELNEEWEYYEEPKGTYFINTQGDVQFWDSSSFAYPDDWSKEKQIGNYFETKEEAEKAVEKLKAWKRLKDKGFEFINFPYKKICKYDARTGVGNLEYQVKYYEELEPDLDLLFGGEE